MHFIDDLISKFLNSDNSRGFFIDLVPKFKLKFEDFVNFYGYVKRMLVIL